MKNRPWIKEKKSYDSINPVNGPSKLYILIYILSWLLGNIYFFVVRTIFLIHYVVIIQSSVFKGKISLKNFSTERGKNYLFLFQSYVNVFYILCDNCGTLVPLLDIALSKAYLQTF